MTECTEVSAWRRCARACVRANVQYLGAVKRIVGYFSVHVKSAIFQSGEENRRIVGYLVGYSRA